jgi:aspartyl/asparaginyl beta-hydroxylase (cupin superfamily)
MNGVPLMFNNTKELDINTITKETIIDDYNDKCKPNEPTLVTKGGLIYLKKLKIKPYHDTHNYSFLKPFEANFDSIQEEFNNMYNTKIWNVSPDSKHYNVFSEMENNWTTACFYFEGKWNPKMKQLCPKTYELLKQVPYLFSWACFSRLKPHTNIPFHKGETNINLTCHIGMQNLKHTRLIVNGIGRKWEKGKCLVFDDTFMHGVQNNSSKERVVLAFDFINPLLSGNEKSRLKKTYLKIAQL